MISDTAYVQIKNAIGAEIASSSPVYKLLIYWK